MYQALLRKLIMFSGKSGNVYSEQLEKDVSLVHRLELENKKLASQLEDAKVRGFQENAEAILSLEKENKRYSLTIKQLESLRAKEEQCTIDLESQLSQSLSKIKQMEQIQLTMRDNEEQSNIEHETEVEELQKRIESLRKRQEHGQNDQVRFLEEENKKMAKVKIK